MNFHELRIGNYIEALGLITTVVAIYSNDDEEINVQIQGDGIMEIKAGDAQPIKLTKDLLITSCGFDDNGRYPFMLDGHKYFLKIKDDFIVFLSPGNELAIHFWDVRYLHRLQNLYYALTGKELEIVFNQ